MSRNLVKLEKLLTDYENMEINPKLLHEVDKMKNNMNANILLSDQTVTHQRLGSIVEHENSNNSQNPPHSSNLGKSFELTVLTERSSSKEHNSGLSQ